MLEVLLALEYFEAIILEVVPKEQNERVDALAVETSILQPIS